MIWNAASGLGVIEGFAMFKVFGRAPLVAIAFLVAIALVLAHLTLPTNWIIMALYLVLVMVAAGLAVGYFEGVWDALRARRPGMASLYTLGAFMPWVALLMLCVTAIMIRADPGQWSWLRSTPMVSGYLMTFILAGLLQMASPGALDGNVPRANWIKVGFVVGGGIIAAVLMIVFGDIALA